STTALSGGMTVIPGCEPSGSLLYRLESIPASVARKRTGCERSVSLPPAPVHSPFIVRAVSVYVPPVGSCAWAQGPLSFYERETSLPEVPGPSIRRGPVGDGGRRRGVSSRDRADLEPTGRDLSE